MAIEAKRGCGFRKVGGIYLRGTGDGVPCDRLPLALTVCPCCSHGFKQSRGWTWVDLNLLVQGVHRNCCDDFPCPLCMATSEMGRCGLLWIGEKFYPTPGDFLREAAELGISRRISTVPREFELGKTWVLLAHAKGMSCGNCCGSGISVTYEDDYGNGVREECKLCNASGKVPAIFRVFKPCALEIIITESQAKDEAYMADLAKRQLTPVVVPDDDRDHQGSVYDKEAADDSGTL